MKIQITARKLRLLLAAALIPLVAGGIGLFILGYNQQLTPAAKNASDAATQAKQGNDEQTNLLRTKRSLELNKDAVKRAQDIVAISTQYKYQDQLTADVYKLASKEGIGVASVTFTSSTPTPGAAAAPPAVSGTGATPVAGPGGSAATVAPTAALKTASATITLNNPIPYENFLRFLYSVEQNATKMRIQSISLSAAGKTEGGAPTSINSNALTIEVYLDGNTN